MSGIATDNQPIRPRDQELEKYPREKTGTPTLFLRAKFIMPEYKSKVIFIKAWFRIITIEQVVQYKELLAFLSAYRSLVNLNPLRLAVSKSDKS